MGIYWSYCVVTWSPTEGLSGLGGMVRRALFWLCPLWHPTQVPWCRGRLSLQVQASCLFKGPYDTICYQATHLQASLSFRLMEELGKALGILKVINHIQLKEHSKMRHEVHVPREDPTLWRIIKLTSGDCWCSEAFILIKGDLYISWPFWHCLSEWYI